MNISLPKVIGHSNQDKNNDIKRHSIDIKNSSQPNKCGHSVGEQLLSLSTSPKNSSSSNSSGRSSSFHYHHYHHHQQRHGSNTSDQIRLQSEALRKTFDDLDKESHGSQSQDNSIIQESVITRSSTPMSNVSTAALYVPVTECPVVTPNLYVPLPSRMRHYLNDPPDDILPNPPYPLRTRQPISKRLQRITNSLISGTLVTSDDHQQRSNLIKPLRKRHSLASGQIDRLVHAHRDALAAKEEPVINQIKSEPKLWWPVPSTPSPENYIDFKPPPTPPSPKISILSPPDISSYNSKHPFEK
ncbi:hypothetical protein BDC45DRAFT_609811 [Circinella umbellata]|nr:hypothetical protein BDC45DRAFT_609811 [Circinella umbellata]